jgi:hypothetical protein
VSKLVCKFCGTAVTPKTAYQLVQGWERPGKGKYGQSGSSLVLREHLQEFACVGCITRLQQGFNTEQQSLLAS